MSTLAQRLVDIARLDVGKTEVSRNRAPWIQKFWPATTYPAGHADRQPYCAAAVAYWVREWLRDPEVLAALKMTPVAAERWRCKSARAFDWGDWGRTKGLTVLPDTAGIQLLPGDLMVFDMSHIGVVSAPTKGNLIATIEANTGPSGGRDGDGCWAKSRARSLARCFVRLIG